MKTTEVIFAEDGMTIHLTREPRDYRIHAVITDHVEGRTSWWADDDEATLINRAMDIMRQMCQQRRAGPASEVPG